MKAMGITKKITAGFILVLLFLTVLASRSIWGISSVVTNASSALDANQIRAELIQRKLDHFNWVNVISTMVAGGVMEDSELELNDHSCRFSQWLSGDGRTETEHMVTESARLLSDIEGAHHRLHESAQAISKIYEPVDAIEGQILYDAKIAHLVWSQRVFDGVIYRNLDVLKAVEADPQLCDLGRWLYSDRIKARAEADQVFGLTWLDLDEHHRMLHEGLVTIKTEVGDGDWDQASAHFFATIKQERDEVLGFIDLMLGSHNARMTNLAQVRAIFTDQTLPELKLLQQGLDGVLALLDDHVNIDHHMLTNAKATKRDITLIGVLAVLAGILIAVQLTRSFVSSLTEIIVGLEDGSAQVASASKHVAKASQDQASGASIQSASIERTSVALQEMKVTSKENATNMEDVQLKAEHVCSVARDGSESMSRLSDTIASIKESSDRSAQIVKTIDEIAFQTNLLALNAAVEAARAGDAGRGFAVVAEEVRALAQRSSKAARDTAELIRSSQEDVLSGVVVKDEANDILVRIIQDAEDMNKMVYQVSTASAAQARGIDEINRDIGQLDTVTQSNAAGSEEMASSSQELLAQSSELSSMVHNLGVLLHGKDSDGFAESRTTKSRRRPPVKAASPSLPSSSCSSDGGGRDVLHDHVENLNWDDLEFIDELERIEI